VSSRSVEGLTNWSRNVTSAPREVAHPATADELADLITAASQAGRPVKPVGRTLVQFDCSQQWCPDQPESTDRRDQRRSRHGSGDSPGRHPLVQLNLSLAAEGLALENLGDIDKQTITGAISTGTHGTGARFGGLATQLRRLMIMTADGAQLRCSATEHPDIYDAARVGLGALGVITEVTLQWVSAFQLHAVEGPARWMRFSTASRP
jgi:FAD/FMN-containing dehydrogenase